MNPSTMDDEELVETHEDMLRAQRAEFEAGHGTAARDVAGLRQDVWEEARERGIEGRLGGGR
jgi:hypothetical protein